MTYEKFIFKEKYFKIENDLYSKILKMGIYYMDINEKIFKY